MGDSEIKTTSTSSPLNPKVNDTLSSLLGGIDDIWKGGPATFEHSLYPGAGDTTKGAWTSGISAASNPAWYAGLDRSLGYTNNLIQNGGLTSGRSPGGYQTGGQPMGGPQIAQRPSNPLREGENIGVEGTPGNLAVRMDNPQGLPGGGGQQGDLANIRRIGDQYGVLGDAYSANSPGISQLRTKLQDDTLTGVNSIFGGSGRLGSGQHMTSAAEGLGNALAGFDYTNYQNDVNNRYRSLDSQAGNAGTAFGMEQQGVLNSTGAMAALPEIFRTSMLPAQTLATIGASQDADKIATLQGQHDYFRRQQDAKVDLLAKLSSILSGTAGAGGTTTTNTEPGTPWWMTGASLLGQFI